MHTIQGRRNHKHDRLHVLTFTAIFIKFIQNHQSLSTIFFIIQVHLSTFLVIFDQFISLFINFNHMFTHFLMTFKDFFHKLDHISCIWIFFVISCTFNLLQANFGIIVDYSWPFFHILNYFSHAFQIFLRFKLFSKTQKTLKNAFFSETLANALKMNRNKVVQLKISYRISSIKFWLRNIIIELWAWAHVGVKGRNANKRFEQKKNTRFVLSLS